MDENIEDSVTEPAEELETHGPMKLGGHSITQHHQSDTNHHNCWGPHSH